MNNDSINKFQRKFHIIFVHNFILKCGEIELQNGSFLVCVVMRREKFETYKVCYHFNVIERTNEEMQRDGG